MTIHELCVALQSLEPEDDVFVALYVANRARGLFPSVGN